MTPTSKKGIELSITFIVILIITVLLLVFSLYLLGIIGYGAASVGEQLDRTTQARIEALLKQENAIVAVPFNVKDVDVGEFALFGVGIKNIGNDSTFGMIVRFDGAYSPDGRTLAVDDNYVNERWVGTSKESTPLPLRRNEYRSLGFTLKVDDRVAQQQSTPAGDYVFNVCVYRVGDDKPSCLVDSLTTEASLLYPPGKIYQVTIRV